MAKVVYNACYGGFSLSHKGIERYAELKGLKLYPEPLKTFQGVAHEYLMTYWLSPPEGRDVNAPTLYDRDIERHDPFLVQVVEELGDEASGDCSALCIAEIEGNRYRIDEYDGHESVQTPDDIDWTDIT